MELDTESPAPERGVNLVIKSPEAKWVTFSLRNVTLEAAFEAIALQSGYSVEVREYLVMLEPRQ